MTEEDFRSQDRMPPYDMMDKAEREELLLRVMELIVKWQPLPRALLEPLPTSILRRLELAIRHIREAGMAGGPEGAPMRLKILRAALELKGVDASPQPKGMSENEVLRQQPLSVQRQVKAQEGMDIRKAQVQEAVLLEEALRKR